MAGGGGGDGAGDGHNFVPKLEVDNFTPATGDKKTNTDGTIEDGATIDSGGKTIENPLGVDLQNPQHRKSPPEDLEPDEDGLSVEQFNSEQITNPTIPPGGAFDPVTQVPNEEELLQGEKLNKTGANVDTTATAKDVQKKTAATVKADTIGNKTPVIDAQQGTLSDQSLVTAAQQDGGSKAFNDAVNAAFQDVQGEVDPRSLVQVQYSTLMDFDVNEIPGWAAGAMRAAKQAMAGRGISGSTIAGEAITTALMQAAMPIAFQDAKVFETMNLQNINRRGQVAVLKASHLANIDISNLNNRQQSAVFNAQAFLEMDMTNLSNRQQTAVLNSQARLQTLLSDQASRNTARQFNATSKNQINMFYKNLTAQIRTFNAEQQNEVKRFNKEMVNMRDQFNVKNALFVEQSNVGYLRDVNTANTALINQANFVNSQNLLEISNTALANGIQVMRDREAFVFEMSENERDRMNIRWVEAFRGKNAKELAEREEDFLLGTSIGNWGATMFNTVLTSALT